MARACATFFCVATQYSMSPVSRQTFAKLLIGKSVCEALLVIVVAAGLFLATTNSGLHGGLDRADAQTISGWATDDSNPSRRVEVQLYIDEKFIEQRSANESRPDLRQTKRAGDDWHGFVFTTPPLAAGEHEAKVYILHRGVASSRRTLQIVGNAIRFKTSP